MKKLIQVKNVVKTFDKQVVLKGISLDIYENEFVTLLGPSGCGKTTLLRIIAGFLEPSEGHVIMDGEDIAKVPAYKRDVNTVFQHYALFPHLNVYENIAFGLKIKKQPKDIIDQKVRRMISLVGLEGFEKRDVTKMSGGQQQRVAIARALVKEPKVLLLDEPLSNLDARLRLSTREEIRRIQKETGITTVFVTHDQEEAMSISDLMVVMKSGVLQQIDRPQKIYDDPKNLFVAKFLGTPAINVFNGYIKEHQLYIGNDSVMNINLDDQDVIVGIRPEGFEKDETGRFQCQLKRIEKLGRDTSVICEHEGMQGEYVRMIVPSETKIDTKLDTISFDIKPNKLFLFDAEKEERIPFEAE